MKLTPPEFDGSVAEWRAFGVATHACVEQGREENRTGFRRLNFAALSSMAGLILAILTIGYKAVQWTDHVDAKLETLLVAGAGRDVRLNKMDGAITTLSAIAEDNHRTLVGTDRIARRARPVCPLRRLRPPATSGNRRRRTDRPIAPSRPNPPSPTPMRP